MSLGSQSCAPPLPHPHCLITVLLFLFGTATKITSSQLFQRFIISCLNHIFGLMRAWKENILKRIAQKP